MRTGEPKIPCAGGDVGPAVRAYLAAESTEPLWLCGDAREVLGAMPEGSVQMCMTSPPYWGKRRYAAAGIGQEPSWEAYVESLLEVLAEVRRVLDSAGSLWLNLGDAYRRKALLGLPWRVALALTDRQGWVLRNGVVWHKIKGGMDNAGDRLANVHEMLFHLVKRPRGYRFDLDAIRNHPRQARVRDGAVVSATGVTGVRYRRQIELSTALDPEEKAAATRVLDATLEQVRRGKISDFRMVLRGRQRPTHSDSVRVSGRARELRERGFYVLRYHPGGAKPGDVWAILPEDSHRAHGHYAAYPADLCRMPILATCPPGGVVLDPFCGTGTTGLVARALGRRSIGVEVSADYLRIAAERCG